MDEPRIATDVDFERDGKQMSYLGVPSSTNESAYGTVPIPITVLKNGSGPTIAFTGGNHGDEYESQVALMKLARRLQPDEIQGRVIMIPSLNLPAAMAGLRCSPIDSLNLNRVFPGDREGTITMVIAEYICTNILPLCNYLADLHSGGTTLEYMCCAIITLSGNDEQDRAASEALKAFGAPINLLNKALDDTGNLSFEAARRGIVVLNTELGGAARVTPDYVRITERGVLNLLKHLGVMEGDPVRPEDEGEAPSRYVDIEDLKSYVMAPDDGLYEPFIELGDSVESGQAIGQVHFQHHIEREPWVVHTERSGFLLCKRPPGRVARGDNIAIIGRDIAEPQA